MANPNPTLKYRVTEGIFDSKSMLDETNFYHQRQGSPSELTQKLTFIMGDYTKKYPISLMTIGGVGFDGASDSNRAMVEIQDTQFTYPVMGRLTKACMTTGTILYSGSDKPGIGNGTFKLRFNDNWLKRFYVIQSPRGIQAYIHADPEIKGVGEYEYTVQLDAAVATDFCPLSELNNMAWAPVGIAVAESESRTTESHMAMPGAYKNQMGFLRHGFSWAGNAAEKIMKIWCKTDKGETNVWMDWAMWQYEDDWASVNEHNAWYSRYNRLSNGIIPLKDMLTGKVIPRGSGLLEQIQNKSTYADLTYDFLVNQVGDALFGYNDTQSMAITLHGGRGAARVFDRALRKAGATILNGFIGTVAEKFITGTGYNLALGGYYDTLYHIDGYLIKFKHNPIFDMGQIAIAQQASGYTHPETGWPLESYRMVFIDDNDVDGQPNIQHVAQKGRSFQHGVIPGLTNMPRSLKIMNGSFNLDKDSLQIISTDQDKSAYTRLKSAGWQILRANRCFDFQCIAGQ